MAHYLCDRCGVDFHAPPCKRKGKQTYCTMECARAAYGERGSTFRANHVQCRICKKAVPKRPPSRAPEGRWNYCSQECYAIGRERDAEKRRQKDERDKINIQLRIEVSDLERKWVLWCLSRRREKPAQFLRRLVKEEYLREREKWEKEKAAKAQ